ncbi:MAG TPA: hypothetical protein VFM48_05855 [Aquabacterium sp.]|nr:hypothetical protein [Aquabacterium sp.]
MILRSRSLNWAQQIDFVGPRRSTSVWGWALLSVGVAATLFVVDHASRVDQAIQEDQADLRRLERAMHQKQIDQAPRTAASAARADWTPEALQSAQGVVRLLAYPWASVLDRVEQAALQEQALLLSISVDQDRGLADDKAVVDVKVSAAVQSDDAALHWADAHGPHAQLVLREKLSSPAPSPQGDYPWRALISWDGALK